MEEDELAQPLSGGKSCSRRRDRNTMYIRQATAPRDCNTDAWAEYGETYPGSQCAPQLPLPRATAATGHGGHRVGYSKQNTHYATHRY